jgi:large subunit ribosomal protein L22e
MREWLRVVSTDKNTYTLRFYNVQFDGDSANVDEE